MSGYYPMESTMNTMLRWSPSRQFHFHHDVDDLFLRFVDGVTDETVQRPASWLPAAEGRIENGTYVIQLALPGVDPKDVAVSLMDNVLTVKGERAKVHGSDTGLRLRGPGHARQRGDEEDRRACQARAQDDRDCDGGRKKGARGDPRCGGLAPVLTHHMSIL